MYFPCFKPFYLTQSTVATAFHHQCDDPVQFCCFPCFKPFYLTKSTVATVFHYQCDDPMLFSCFKPFYLTKSTVATAFHYQCDDPVLFSCFPCFKPFYLNKSTVATTHFTTSVTIQCCFPVFPVSNHSISPKALLLLRISPLVWRSSAVFLFQTILSHQKHCCYYASPPVWRSNEVLLFSLFQTILSHQKHFSPKALLLLRISPPVWRSGAVFPVLNHSISPKALLLLHFTTSVTIQCCFPCFKPFYLTKSTVATAFHYQCDDPVLFSCFKPFYLTKSTVATTHFTTSVTIQCCFPVFPVSNHSISPKALLLLHFTTSVTIQCSSAVSLFQTILSHQKHCCYYAFHHECDDPVQFCCFPVSNHSISPKALLLLRISPPVWRSSAVLLFQTILSYQKHCCYCISLPVWRSKPFYLTKSTVATTHLTVFHHQCSCAVFSVSNHSYPVVLISALSTSQ